MNEEKRQDEPRILPSPAHLDYIQRADARPDRIPMTATDAIGRDRRLQFRVDGIGSVDKSHKRRASTFWLPMQDVLVGLYGSKIPYALNVRGYDDIVVVEVGTWLEGDGSDAARLKANGDVLTALLRGAYSGLVIGPPEEPTKSWPLGALALGVPTRRSADPLDGALPWDRLIRSMSGLAWSVLILAQAVDETTVLKQRNSVLNEMRVVATQRDGSRVR